MRKVWLFLVSALTVLAFVITPTSAGAAVDTEGLWETTDTPPCIANGSSPLCAVSDFGSLELGVKFQTSEPIYVVGVRFYRADSGTWSGSLWDADSTWITSALDSTSGAGWQTAMFGTPQAMGPGDTFVASYFAPGGAYAFEWNYFTAGGRTVGPVTALGGAGVNGVFNPGSSSVFPTQTFRDTNYWVTPLWVEPYEFEGFFAPVDNDALNVAKAGSSIPIKFRVTHDGAPVTDLTTPPVKVTSQGAACEGGEVTDAIEVYAGGSGLQNLGDGYYQYNWKTPKSYKGQCRTMTLSLGDGSGYTADFKFN